MSETNHQENYVAVGTNYQSFDNVLAESSSPPPMYERIVNGGESSAILRNTKRDSNLAADLQLTVSGRRERTRGTTRNRPLLDNENDADSDVGSDDSSVDEDYEVASILSSIEEGLTWRGHMQRILHSRPLHLIVAVLVITDALIVMFELLFELGAFNNFECYGSIRINQTEYCHHYTDGKCGPTAKQILHHLNITPSRTGEENLCACLYRGGRLVCGGADELDGINPAIILAIFSLVILTFFMFEIVLKIIAFRLKYFTHKFEIIDGAVVVVSWMLDIASLAATEAFETAAQFVILIRLWRLVRIVNGAFLSSKAQSDRKLQQARAEARRIIHAFHKCQDKLDQAEEQNAKMRKRLELLEGSANSQINKCS